MGGGGVAAKQPVSWAVSATARGARAGAGFSELEGNWLARGEARGKKRMRGKQSSRCQINFGRSKAGLGKLGRV